MKELKKIGIFILLFAGLTGAIAAPIALGVFHSWLPMVGSLVVDAFAARPYISLVKKLINE